MASPLHAGQFTQLRQFAPLRETVHAGGSFILLPRALQKNY